MEDATFLGTQVPDQSPLPKEFRARVGSPSENDTATVPVFTGLAQLSVTIALIAIGNAVGTVEPLLGVVTATTNEVGLHFDVTARENETLAKPPAETEITIVPAAAPAVTLAVACPLAPVTAETFVRVALPELTLHVMATPLNGLPLESTAWTTSGWEKA